MYKIPQFALIKYNINDIKISETVRKERIYDLRKKTDVLVIDDEGFEPQRFLEQNHYRLTKKDDIENIRDVSEYSIILCDIRGVGRKLSESFEGAFVIKEIKDNYPEKAVIAYTASQYDPNYNLYLQRADVVLQKSISMEEWLDILDQYIFKVTDPVVQWKLLRDKLISIDVPLIDVAKLESAFVCAYIKDEFAGFEKVAKSMNTEVSSLVGEFLARVVVKLARSK